MTKTPEEYFQDQEFQPQPDTREETFTEAEKAFLEKYLGLEEPGILEKLGIDVPVEARSVPVEPGPLAEPEPGPALEEALEEAFDEAPGSEVEPEPAAQPDAMPEPEPESASELPEEEPAAAPEEEAEAEPVVQEDAGAAQDHEAADELRTATAEPELELEDQLRQQESLQLVSFYVGYQEYTLPIEAVQEVVRAVKPTKVPEAPAFMAGMVNLRGRVTPLVRLDELLGIERGRTGTDGEKDDGEDRFIIVCSQGGLQVGLQVRKVATMYRVAQSNIEWNIESRLGGAVELVTALMRRPDDSLVGIVSIDRVVERIMKR